MNDRSARRYDMFKRADVFGTENLADFTAGSETLKRFAHLKQNIAGLDDAKAGQSTGGNTSKAVLLDALRLDIQNITRTARAIDQDEPGFTAKFPAPASPSDGDLLTNADRILAQLAVDPADAAAVKTTKAALAKKFTDHELDANFVQNLSDDRAAIDEANKELEGNREGGVENTAAIDRLIRDGMKDVTYLDAAMHNKYARNADKLRAWLSATHIERAPQRAKKTQTPTPTPLPNK